MLRLLTLVTLTLLGSAVAVPLEHAPRSNGLTPIYKTCHKDGLVALTMDDGIYKYVSLDHSPPFFGTASYLRSSFSSSSFFFLSSFFLLAFFFPSTQHSSIQNTFDDAGVKACRSILCYVFNVNPIPNLDSSFHLPLSFFSLRCQWKQLVNISWRDSPEPHYIVSTLLHTIDTDPSSLIFSLSVDVSTTTPLNSRALTRPVINS